MGSMSSGTEHAPRVSLPSGLLVERFDARVWPDAVLDALFSDGFPAFITADQEAKKYIGRVREWFPHLYIAVVADGDVLVAVGWGVPIRWNGDVSDLPAGYSATLCEAVELHEAAGDADTFVICGAIVHPGRKGSGLAASLIEALCGLADQQGLDRVIAPLRPTLKHRYPLTPIEEYVAWVRDDGAPFDPWLRLHSRVGGAVIATASQSQTMTGTVAEWEAWSEMALPATGDYVIPGGLSLLHIDHQQDLGTYVEPNIWVRHR